MSNDPLELVLDIPPEAASGAPVPIVLRVRNDAARPLDLYLRGRTITFDVAIDDAGGRTVWRRLEGEPIPAIVRLRTLAPGETLALRADWDGRTTAGDRAPPGEYRVRGLLLTDGPEPLATPPASLRLR